MSGHEQNSQEFSFKSFLVPLTTLKAIHWIFFIGIIVYANSLFNSFILDDSAQIVGNIEVHSITSIPDILQNTMHSTFTSDYYRPLPFIFYAGIYNFFQDNTFFFHFFQLSIYITNAILIFLIFKKYVRLNIAFFLSLLFLVHPINESTVVYIANLQDVLFVFFGLISFLLLQKNTSNLKLIVLSNIFLLLSLLSKETGILFMIINLAYLLLFKKNRLLMNTVFSFLAGFIYSILRILAHVPLQKDPIEPIMALSFTERMIQIPSIIFYYICTLLFPKNLVFLHTSVITTPNFQNFFLPLINDSFVFFVVIVMAIFVYKKTSNMKLLFFSLFWLGLGILAHLQFIPLDYTVADRFFYFPMIGLLLFAGLFLETFNISTNIKTTCIGISILLLVILSIRTMIRNTDWQNQATLITHDEKLSHNDYQQELLYGVALGNENKFDDAIIHTKKAITLYPRAWIAWDTLGALYLKKGDIGDAKKALSKSITINNLYFSPYENMAMILWEHDNTEKTRTFTTKATALFPYSAKLWYYRFLSDYATKHFDDAEIAARNYYFLKQDTQSYEIYYRIQNNLPIQLVK